jgi:Flp pilus assembly protein TadG
MIRTRQRNQSRLGTASVELALLSPILVSLLLGIWEVGRLVEVQQIVSNSAREGARQASTGLKTTAQCQTAVTDYLTNAGLSTTGVNVTVTNITHGGDVINALQLDHLQCTVSFPFNNAKWMAIDWFVPNGTSMTAAADWYSMKDVPLTVNQTIPSAP